MFPWPWLYPYSPGAQWEIEPEGIYANATLRFVKWFDAYPASQWTLYYGMAPYAGGKSGPIKFQSASLNSSDWHIICVEPAITATWTPGKYTWQCFAQNNSNPTWRHFVGSGTIDIAADLTNSASCDTRTKWMKILDEIDDMILRTAGFENEKVEVGKGTIAGYSIEGWKRADLLEFRDYAAMQAGNDRRIMGAKSGAPNPRFKYAVMGNNLGVGGVGGFGNIFGP